MSSSGSTSTQADAPAGALKLPPGRLGAPFLGETRAWIRDPYAFFEERTREFGPVFKTRILGKNFVCLAGPEAFGFAMDETYFERTGASQFDAATYDIVLFYAHAMKEGKITGDPAKLADERTKVRDILRAMPPYPALEGPISFGKNGDALKPVYIIEMQDGKWNLIATHASAS